MPCLARLLLLHLQELTLADGKRHIHRIAADDHGERTAVGTDHVAHCQFGTPDLSGDRCGDLGVAEVHVCCLEVGIRDDGVALRALFICHALIQQCTRSRICLDQLLRAPAL